MKKRKGPRKVVLDKDLDSDVENYAPSGSDDGLDAEDKELLANAVGRRRRKEQEEVLKIYRSEDEDSDEEGEEEVDDEDESEDDGRKKKKVFREAVGSDMDSDIDDGERDDGLPDEKAWGPRRSQYYNTDFVDKDYLGFDDEEGANEEEKEADIIQRRLLSHLEGTDFTFGLLDTVEDKKKEAIKKREEEPVFEEEEQEKVEVDLSKLSHNEVLELLNRESPELSPIVSYSKELILYLRDKVWPVLEMVDTGKIKKCRAVDFLEVLYTLALHYAVNVLFYLHIKEAGERTSDHPVLKRLKGLRGLLDELEVMKEDITTQIESLLLVTSEGQELLEIADDKPEVQPKNRKERRKRKLELLKKQEEVNALIAIKKQKLMMFQEDKFENELQKQVNEKQKAGFHPQFSEEEEDDGVSGEAEGEEDTKFGDYKRRVSFQILKNKGLTPKRKKENRNPRVKNRNKFKKAMIRRKGQFREPRTELTKYGGELSGIKAYLSKSIKFK